jgi:transcriptional regulator
MYIPKPYQMNDKETVIDFIKDTSFGLLVSHSTNIQATHLPFILNRFENETILYSHMALANPQWRSIEEQEVLVVFSGPNKYISPSWYKGNEGEVPTWDYVSAHVYGHCKVVSDRDELEQILVETIDFFEATQSNPWNLGYVNKEYYNHLFKQIIGIKINVTRIEAAWKLHQDYSSEIKNSVIETLGNQVDDNSRMIAELIRKNLQERDQ